MRREIPLIITFVVGITLLSSYFFSGTIPGTTWVLAKVATDITGWGIIVTAFAAGLASVNLIRIHAEKIARKRQDWINSVALVVSLAVFFVVGVYVKHYPKNISMRTFSQNIFDNIYSPYGAAMFAILGFYVASASYRAFRARSFEASLLLGAAVLMMLGSAPIGVLLWNQFPIISGWLLNVVNSTGQRGINIGLAIGAFATAMRLLIGLDRGHLGSGE
ncbi:MAG: hypothetical protein FD169_732 [Bacillota bacterium]|nr:MAG: hypothetical protein FD169_732 [Bacillota bacterium]